MTNPLTFKPILKDRYFYNKYRYCVTFYLDEVSALKTLDHGYIDAVISRRQLWREVAQQRWVTTRRAHNGTIPKTILTHRWKEITEKTSNDLHELAEILISTSIDFKLVTSVNQSWIYSNSQTLLKKIDKLSCAGYKQYTEAVISRPKNTIKLKSSKYRNRSYCKSIKLTDREKETIMNFLVNQGDHIRISPALLTWFKTPYHRTQDYFFIDHLDESWLVMLSLVHPGLIRKTVEIITA